MKRCAWCPENVPEYQSYHDEEWGVPVHDDRHLFEMLCLEGMQAGLTWLSILRRRENYRLAFDNFDAEKIVTYGEEKIAELLNNPGIIRNRLKVRAIVKNARACLDIREEFGSLDAYLWGFTEGKPRVNRFSSLKEIPAETALSQAISKDLKKRGMSFVGPVIIYAFMQAVGMVNDHETGCFRYGEV
ncbi:MAG: DNA-3-methyladenine glycosylase I [Spirochaetales bacterium]|nr:DNA-3-methyladenine glycosylase I [Spirochaetales bacterium]